MDKQSLVQRVEQFCEGKTAAHLVRQIQAVTPRKSFFSNAVLGSLVERLSAQYRSSLRQRESAYYACFFHFRVLHAALERRKPLLARENQALRSSIVLICWQALFDAEPELIQLFPKNASWRIRALSPAKSTTSEAGNTHTKTRSTRNSAPRLSRFCGGSIPIVPYLPISNLKEYQTITGRLEAGDSLGQELFAVCNQAIDTIVEKFSYFPAWPIVDYTSDFILGRRLSGQFRYWERESQPHGQLRGPISALHA